MDISVPYPKDETVWPSFPATTSTHEVGQFHV